MKRLDGITDAMDMNLDNLQEMVRDREAWHAVAHGVTKSQTWLSDWTKTWNLEREWWTYLQNNSGNTDMENRLVDTAGEGEGGANWQNSMETYALPYVK